MILQTSKRNRGPEGQVSVDLERVEQGQGHAGERAIGKQTAPGACLQAGAGDRRRVRVQQHLQNCAPGGPHFY